MSHNEEGRQEGSVMAVPDDSRKLPALVYINTEYMYSKWFNVSTVVLDLDLGVFPLCLQKFGIYSVAFYVCAKNTSYVQ